MAIQRERNYANGKIYSIRSFQTQFVHYGSTLQPLCKRLVAKHRENLNNIVKVSIIMSRRLK